MMIGLIDSLRLREAFPIRKDVRGNIVDGRNKFGMLDPDVPDFAGGDRNVRRALHALDHLNQVADFLLVAVDRLVADDDAVDVAVALCEIDHRADFALVAILIFVDPCAGRNAQPEFRRYARHEFDAAGRRICADRARVGREQLEIGANLRGLRRAAGIRMRGAFERRVGNARELAFEVGGANIIAR